MSVRRLLATAIVAGSVVLTMAAPAGASVAGARTSRVSVASDGTQGNNISSGPALSADGRYVAFESFAANLVPGDTNGFNDVFVRDRRTGTTSRVSVASDGTQGNGDVFDNVAISADGRFVAFESLASNLVPDDTNGTWDVFVRDRWAGTTSRVSVASDGTQGNNVSYFRASISANGRWVAYMSAASNLVPDDTNGTWDVFVRDRWAGTTTRVSVGTDGTQGNDFSWIPVISADGRYVAFESRASNLVPGDTNGANDVILRDQQTGTTTRISVATNGVQGNDFSAGAGISADGRYVGFHSLATNLVPDDTNGVQDIFVRDRLTGTTTRVSVAGDGSQANDFSAGTAISDDGRYVAFLSAASNLVPHDTNGTWDIFVRDRWAATTRRASVASDGTQANDVSTSAVLSADGRYVAFESWATNLVPGDTNGTRDVFIRRQPG
jgi:Tol biopolymer transport system component